MFEISVKKLKEVLTKLLYEFTLKRLLSSNTAGFITASICNVRDFERFTCQNSYEPHMRLDTNLAFLFLPSNRRFGGAYFLQKLTKNV
jgi:hypothetical protein